MPERLYGREREIAILLAAVDRVVASGGPELVLVLGLAGDRQIDGRERTPLRALVPPRGLFASGKFD